MSIRFIVDIRLRKETGKAPVVLRRGHIALGNRAGGTAQVRSSGWTGLLVW